jgi:SHS2 domain-containing protein
MSKEYQFLEHTADVYVAAYGKTMEEAFENAAKATIKVMTDPERVEASTIEEIEIKGSDLETLLYDWIEEILVRFDAYQKLYSEFDVNIIEDNGKLVLKARIGGEVFDPDKHSQNMGVKAITFHRMEIERKPDNITLKFVLDV